MSASWASRRELHACDVGDVITVEATVAEVSSHKVIDELLRTWHSEIQLESGRPHHPQSQGLVERAHYTLQRKLAAENNRTKLKQPPWNSWLPRIACKLLCVYFFKYKMCPILHIDYVNSISQMQ